MNDNKKVLKEMNLTWVGKLFFSGIASYLGNTSETTPKIPIKIKATKEQIKAVMDIVQASKDLQQAINEQDIPIERVIEKMQAKSLAKKRFFDLMKVEWPL